MDREPVRRAGGRAKTTHLRCATAAVLAVALLWVPTVGRALEPLAGHAIAGTTKLNKSAVLPHDPTPSVFYTVPIIQPVQTVVEPFRVVLPLADQAAVDRAREGIGLRAPPASVL